MLVSLAGACLHHAEPTPSVLLQLQLPAALRQCYALNTRGLARRAPPGSWVHTRAFHATRYLERFANKIPVYDIPDPQKDRPRSPPLRKRPSYLRESQKLTSQLPDAAAATPPPTPATAAAAAPRTPVHVPRPTKHDPSFIPQYRVSSHQSFLTKLATAPEPTVLYTSASQSLYTGVCLASSLFCGYLGYFNFATVGGFTSAHTTSQTLVVYSGFATAVVWYGIGWYLGYGPVGTVKRITAVPAAPSFSPRNTLKPTLRVEPFKLGFGVWPKPFDVKLGDMYVDRSIAAEAEKIAHFDQLEKKQNPGFLDPLLNGMSNFFHACRKMWTRKAAFTRLRVPDRGNFKLDLRQAQLLQNGAALDELVKLDHNPSHWRPGMFRRD